MTEGENPLATRLCCLRDAVRAALRTELWDDASGALREADVERLQVDERVAEALRSLFSEGWEVRRLALLSRELRRAIGKLTTRVLDEVLRRASQPLHQVWAWAAQAVFRAFPARDTEFHEAMAIAVAGLPARVIWFAGDHDRVARRFLWLTIASRLVDRQRRRRREVLDDTLDLEPAIVDELGLVEAAASPERAVVAERTKNPIWQELEAQGADPDQVHAAALESARADGRETLARNIKILLDVAVAGRNSETDYMGRLAIHYFGADTRQTRNLISQARGRAARAIAKAWATIGSISSRES